MSVCVCDSRYVFRCQVVGIFLPSTLGQTWVMMAGYCRQNRRVVSLPCFGFQCGNGDVSELNQTNKSKNFS